DGVALGRSRDGEIRQQAPLQHRLSRDALEPVPARRGLLIHRRIIPSGQLAQQSAGYVSGEWIEIEGLGQKLIGMQPSLMIERDPLNNEKGRKPADPGSSHVGRRSLVLRVGFLRGFRPVALLEAGLATAIPSLLE